MDDDGNPTAKPGFYVPASAGSGYVDTVANPVGEATVTSIPFAGLGVTLNLTEQGEGFTIIGDAYADNITGSGGNDTIEGGGGNDSLFGGNGDDVFRFGNGGFLAGVSVDGGQGTDTLVFTAASQSVADAAFANKSNLEALTLSNGVNSVALQENRFWTCLG